LRFEVFNLEPNEGLAESHFTGLDIDPFECTAANIGYYSEREFDFAAYEPLRGEMIGLGRACVCTQITGTSTYCTSSGAGSQITRLNTTRVF